MVRIVSGQRNDPNEALLQGMELGKGFRQAQMARQEAQAQQMNQALRMQEIQMRFQDARAKREQALAQAAQMGDVKALQEMEMMAKIPESDQMALAAFKVTQGITDPEARKLALGAFEGLITETKAKEQRAAAMRVIEKGIADKTPGAELAQERLATGEEPETIAKELSATAVQTAKDKANTDAAAKFLERAKARLETMTPSARREAEIKIAEFELSPSTQAEPDSGAKLLGDVDTIANRARDKQIVDYVSQRKDAEFLSNLSKAMEKGVKEGKFGEREFPGAFRRFGGDEPPEQPRTPAMQAHVEKQRAEKEKRFPGSTTPQPFVGPMPERKSLKQKEAEANGQPTKATAGTSLPTDQIKAAKSSSEVTQILQSAGVALTPAIAAEVAKIRGKR